VSLPKTITGPTVPLEPTDAPLSVEPSLRRPPIQFRIALISGASPQPASELETQLRKRLRACALVTMVYCVVDLSIGLPFYFSRLLAAPLQAFTWPTLYGFVFLIGCLEGVLVVLLSPRRPTSLSRLRALEWIALAPVVTYSGWGSIVFLSHTWPRILTEPGGSAIAGTNPWGLIAVAYGVLIPNTWRRCAAVVGLILLVGYLPGAFAVLVHDVPARPAFLYLSTKALWLGVAGSIAVYGSYRIEILREEAFHARKLGQYLLKQRLGAGGMGEVYLAEHVLLRRPCAIKLIRPERAGEPANLLRFEREVRTTATLTHPNTVQIYDYGHADDGTFYYVMEYLPGLTLAQLVKRHGPLPAARAVHLLRQVCGALREAHAVGLIHRDIKPANAILCERGGLHDVVKLLDFGLVLAQGIGSDGERLTQEGALAGTPAYMSPEQASGNKDLDARSDIYSVGCLAYFLLTGQPPFAGRSAVRMLAAHIYEPPAPLTGRCPEVPEALQAVVLRCLAKDPAQRFASAGDLENALAACPTLAPWTEEEAACWWRSEAVHSASHAEAPLFGTASRLSEPQ
jgi:serine/threonine-protein kinase